MSFGNKSDVVQCFVLLLLLILMGGVCGIVRQMVLASLMRLVKFMICFLVTVAQVYKILGMRVF